MPTEMKVIRGDKLSIPLRKKILRNRIPEIRIDGSGNIIYANTASQFLIKEGTENKSSKIPDYLLLQFPGLRDFNACFDIEFFCCSRIIKFHVVGFREGGYIGLYAGDPDENDSDFTAIKY